MPSRRHFVAIAGAAGLSAAFAGFALRARAAEPIAPGDTVCRGLVQLADATEGSSGNLTGERAEFDLMEKLGLLEGHLIVGMALMDARMTKDALPHFGHPVKEIYEYLEPVLKARNVPDFKADLIALEARAKATPADPGLGEAYAGVLRKVEALRATIPATMLSSQAFIVQAVALMMRNAADDLGESIEKGVIANAVEYHDALGFARYTASLVQARRGVLGAAAPRIDAELKLVLSAFPSLKPPPKPVRTVAELEKASDRVKALAK